MPSPSRPFLLLAVVVTVLLGLVAVGPSAGAASLTKRQVSIRASRTSSTVGTAVTFSGRLTHSPKGTPLRVQRRSGARWVSVKTIRTRNRAGTWSVAIRLPSVAGSYLFRASAPRRGRLRAATSKAIAVRTLAAPVPPAPPVPPTTPVTVSLSASPGTVVQGGTTRLTGTVSPYVAGTTVSLQHLSGSTWQTDTTTSLDGSGAFSATATPGSSASYRVSVPAVANNAAATSPSLSVEVVAPAVLTTMLPYGQMGVPYHAQLRESTGIPGQWSTQPALPAGLILDQDTGVISGTPTQAETTTVTLLYSRTADYVMETSSASITIGMTAPAPVQVSAGGTSTCRISADKSLWCWGGDGAGELGDGGQLQVDPPGIEAPTQIGTANDWTEISVSGSDFPINAHACGLRGTAAYCWGSNTDNELGQGVSGGSSTAPHVVSGSYSWAAISAGWTNVCGVTTAHQLYCWGDDSLGQSGTGGNNRTTPAQVGTTTDWSTVSAGFNTSCGIKTGGTLWCWGINTDGVMKQVGTDSDWKQVSDGYGQTCAVKTNGGAWCWGLDLVLHQVGSGTAWTQVSAGRDHSCGVTSTGTPWCWGNGDYGQLGDGVSATAGRNVATPVQVGTATDWTVISAGSHDSCGVEGDVVSCWGSDRKGKLGNGPFVADVSAPGMVVN